MQSNRRVKRAARQLFRLCLRDGVLDAARVRLVAERLSTSRRRGALPVLTSFQRLVRLETGRHTAVVESATPLADSVRAQIADGLARTYGHDLETAFRDNPTLIAGVRIKVASDVYDGSVRARLNALEARL
jgi:F-type H+-transporting ATPase subunit delta